MCVCFLLFFLKKNECIYYKWGIQWCFAHNGDVPLFKDRKRKVPWIGSVEGDVIYNCIGDTDSEAIFCAILNALKARFSTLPSLPVLHEHIQFLLKEIVNHDPEFTILNFLLGCGQHVQFAYSWPGSRPGSKVWNGLHYVVREPPFHSVNTTLSDVDYAVDFSRYASDKDKIAVIATVPLTVDENWIEMRKGELILFDGGSPHLAPVDCFGPEIAGHGLLSNAIPGNIDLVGDMRRMEYFAGSDI